jgi:hypothetical protein
MPTTLRGGAVAARWAHNPKVGGSNPPPATKTGEVAQWQSRGLISPWLAFQIRPSPLYRLSRPQINGTVFTVSFLILFIPHCIGIIINTLALHPLLLTQGWGTN